MKKLKIFHNGKRLKDVYPFATKWEVFKYKTARLIRKVFLLAMGVLATSLMVLILLNIHKDETVIFERITDTQYVESETEIPPVMQRIAECESNGSHYAPSGQVVTNGNSNGTVDIGIYQINLYYWSDKATELGYDLTKEEDNIAFAMYLYHNHGTEAWIWSKKCWN